MKSSSRKRPEASTTSVSEHKSLPQQRTKGELCNPRLIEFQHRLILQADFRVE